MAFIREYMAQSGDPFSLRVPRKLRKLKVGRALGRVAKIGLGFIPGLGPVASSLLGGLMAKYPQVPPDLWEGFARSYGLDMGDPGAPAPHPSRRKAATSGPKAKAAMKAEKRGASATRAHTKPASKGHPPQGSTTGRRSIAGAIGAGTDALRELNAFGVKAGDLEKIIGGGKAIFGPGSAGGPQGTAGMFGHRRRINPGNVKALNRSLRRVEGFEKLVKRVMGHKLFKRVRGPIAHRSGHRAGCKCATCRRAA